MASGNPTTETYRHRDDARRRMQDEHEPGDEEVQEHTTSVTLEDIEKLIAQLAMISNAIRRSGTQSRLERADETFEAARHTELSTFLTFLVSLIDPERKYTEHGVVRTEGWPFQVDTIVQRLIEANLRRRHRFLYAQRRYMKRTITAFEVGERKESKRPRLGERPADSELLPASNNQIERSPTVKDLEPAATPSGIASSAPTPMEGTLEIPDGSQPSSIALSSTSSTVIYPRPPKMTKGQGIFKCPCCYQTLPASSARGRRWR